MINKSKKDLIKNIAIIFLVIMLILTFFSNTIMNWSLPQVSGKYSEYGEIKTGLRGSGAVVSNMTYTQTVNGSRTIEEVLVHRGSFVEEGDVLMRLSRTESDKIASLEAEIETLQDSYNRAILSKTESDYTADEIAIRNAEEDLAEIKAKRAEFTEEYIESIKANAEKIENDLKKAEDEVELLEEKLADMTETSTEPEIVSAREALEKAELSLENAEKAYERALEALEEVSYKDTASLESQRDGYLNQLADAKTNLDYAREDNEGPLTIAPALRDKETKELLFENAQQNYEAALLEYDVDIPETVTKLEQALASKNAAEEAKNKAVEKYEGLLVEYGYDGKEDKLKDDIKTAERAIEAYNSQINEIENEIYYIRGAIAAANTENREYSGLKASADAKKETVEVEKEKVATAEKKLDEIVKKLNKSTTDELKIAQKNVKELSEAKAESDEKLLELKQVEALDAEIKSGERSLESMKLSFEQKKKSDSKADELEDYDLGKQLQEINKKKAELKNLQGDSKDGYELCATHAGTVTEVNFKPGEIATDGAAAVVIEVVESGYSISFSVSNSEAQKVKVGDTATVTDTYWGQNVGATLESIVPDSGGQTKTLNFDLSGNVNVGQTLTLLVGEKSTGYSCVIPKNALHEDSNGKFVYVTKTKSTPLGNRYVATRLDVTVAASDDKNVAIVTDDTYLYEYVILSSTKPFEAGDFVRLSD